MGGKSGEPGSSSGSASWWVARNRNLSGAQILTSLVYWTSMVASSEDSCQVMMGVGRSRYKVVGLQELAGERQAQPRTESAGMSTVTPHTKIVKSNSVEEAGEN